MADFVEFQNKFKGDLITPEHPDYLQAIDRWAHNAARRAKIVAFVKDNEDVVLALKYAKAAGLRIAICGGGHSASGASSSEDGLVIDLSRYINGATIDAEKKLAFIGGGALWKTVDNEAIKYGLASVGGTVNHTGVGGLILGGGYGWLSGEHGLVIDNLATVVVADGRVLTASATENEDLFFGIRGGGSNFGVVTEFVLRLHPQRRTVFAGPIIFTPDKIPQLQPVLDSWWGNVKGNEGMVLGMTRGPDGQPGILAVLFYNGSAEEGRKNFKAFYDLGPVADLAAEIPYEELNNMQNYLATPQKNYYMTGAQLSVKPSQDLTVEHFNRIIELSGDGSQFLTAVLLELWPHNKINTIPADATPYRRDLTGNALVLVRWEGEDPALLEKAKEAVVAMKSLLTPGQAYGNYNPDSDYAGLPADAKAPESKVEGLFRQHYPKLQAIKKKYDPEMIFNKWFAITPA
ncbi:FAD-binding domain-containing protein [Abortiporus biennis]|nr:FAD-binding domain-containing protein [Abortiporus biennis]